MSRSAHTLLILKCVLEHMYAMIESSRTVRQDIVFRFVSQHFNRSHGTLQEHFLSRLERLVELQSAARSSVDRRPLKQINGAIYSTYWDCVQLGMQNRARRIVGFEDGSGCLTQVDSAQPESLTSEPGRS
ncbi:MAG: hypothetical protein ACKVVP_12910 [Chloroflexota bacterium]